MNSVSQLPVLHSASYEGGSTINNQPAQRQRPDYEAANRFPIKARWEIANQLVLR
jgi:hypothetical protein